MNLRRQGDRGRLCLRLSEGTRQARQEEARRALPLLASTLERVRSDKATARARFDALREAAGEPAETSPAINPVLQHKARTYALWSPIILLCEAGLAAYTASLTIFGGWVLHLIAGTMATALFTALGKILASAQVEGSRLQASTERLERQLRLVTGIASLLLGGFFVARFIPFVAELALAIASTLLSFAVAYLAGLALTLAELLGAPNREVDRYTSLALLEAELSGLVRMAEELVADEVPTAGQAPRPKAGGLAAVGLVALLVCSPGGGQRTVRGLTLWIDVSGSLAPDEFERLRAVLLDPLPLLEAVGADEVAVTPFWAERHALGGMAEAWHLPAQVSPACEETHTIFTATRKALEEACAAARAKAEESWLTAADEALAGYRKTLAAVDVTVEQKQTCLYPVLDRIAASAGKRFHVVLSDGAHAKCGEAPKQPRAGDSSGVVVLVPDNGIDGVTERMEARAAALRRLYPGLVVIPSWRVDRETDWEALLGSRRPQPPNRHEAADSPR